MRRIFAVIVSTGLALSAFAGNYNYRFLVGTYTSSGKSKGVYAYTADLNNGTFALKNVAEGLSNPSFLALSSDKKYLYTVNESDNSSAANALRFDVPKSKFTFLNRSLTHGKGPCHIVATDKHVITANYGGGSISVFGRNADGSLSELQQLIQHRGHSINTERQNDPHVHQIVVSPDSNYVLTNDLGTDMITVYKYNAHAQKEILTLSDSLKVKAGSGPRHAVFSADGKNLYLAHEIDGTVSVMHFVGGKLSLVQETTVDRTPGTVNRTADIHLSPDGHFLYVSNRGSANNISCFAVNKQGMLSFVQQVPTGGDGPRNFAITPDGNFVFIAHQFTDTICVFKRSRKTGALTDTGRRLAVGAPVCIVFY